MKATGKIIFPAAAVCALSACGEVGEKEELPNIIILYTDDMGYGDMSCQNPESRIPTPHLDNLASNGIRFTDGHSSCAVSSPSRYAILTGKYHWRQTFQVADNFTRPLFGEDELTIADMLRSKGYFTAAIGKWHLGWDWDSILKPGAEYVKNRKGENGRYYPLEMMDWSKPIEGGPCDHGFDYYYGNDCPFHPPYAMIENEHVLEIPTKIYHSGTIQFKEGHSALRSGPMAEGWNPYDLFPNLNKKVVELIRNRDKSKPFFIYYGMPAPHLPIVPNEEFEGKSEAGPYGDYVVETDCNVGQIVAALKEEGIFENTIIVFSSDNGPEHYAIQRMQNYGHNSSTLHGIKRDIYEGGHRVPFIISWPNVIKPGQVSDEVISQVDLMATFASIVEYDLPDDKAVDSYDLMPLLTGKNKNRPVREATVFNTRKTAYAIRKGEWLLINNYTGSQNDRFRNNIGYKEYFDFVQFDKETPGLLFNMEEDPMQTVNLYEVHPEIVADLTATLKRYQDSGRSIPFRHDTAKTSN